MPKEKKQFDFIGKRLFFLGISGALILVGIIFNIIFGTQLDISFKGGTIFSYSFTGEMAAEDIKATVKDTIGQDSDVSFTSDITGTTKQFTITLTQELENKFVYSYTGEINTDAVNTTAAAALGTAVTVTAENGNLTITPTDPDTRIPQDNLTSLTTDLGTLLPDNGVKLLYSNSATDLSSLISDALAEKYGSKLVYGYNGSLDTSAFDTAAEKATGFAVSVKSYTENDVNYVSVTPDNAADGFTSDMVTAISAAAAEADSTAALTSNTDNALESIQSNSVKATVGKGFFIKCIFAVILGALFVTLYVGIRFRKIGGVSAAVFAMLALLHDVLIAYFVYVIFGIPLDDNFIAVVLTLLGYSLNDTIVIYDRIRENERLYGETRTVSELVNLSVNQCFTRNINTSVATFAAIAVVGIVALLNGITSILSFAFPMAVGVVAGCYSSVLLSSPMWAAWREHSIAKKANKKAK